MCIFIHDEFEIFAKMKHNCIFEWKNVFYCLIKHFFEISIEKICYIHVCLDDILSILYAYYIEKLS